MLDDRNPGAEQRRVDGPRRIGRVVDVERVDADERRASIAQVRRRVGRQKRMSFEILIGAPVAVPSGVHEHGLAAHVARHECTARNCAIVCAGDTHDDGIDRCDRIEREVGDIVAVGIAVIGAVDVSARVADISTRPIWNSVPGA